MMERTRVLDLSKKGLSLKDEAVSIRICGSLQYTPTLEAVFSNDPESQDSRVAICHLLSMARDENEEAIRSEIAGFLEKLIRLDVNSISYDNWDNQIDGKRISRQDRESTEPFMRVTLNEMQNLASMLVEEIAKARERLLDWKSGR